MSFLQRRVEAQQRRRERMIGVALRRQARRARGEEREILNNLLDDEDAFDAVVLELANRAPDDGDDTDDNGLLMRILNWFLANWEEIFAIITQVVGIFGGGGLFALRPEPQEKTA